jgi:hypothetical protein
MTRKLYKVYIPGRREHEYVMAENTREAAYIARDYWAESGIGRVRAAHVVEMVMPEGSGVVYEPLVTAEVINF